MMAPVDRARREIGIRRAGPLVPAAFLLVIFAIQLGPLPVALIAGLTFAGIVALGRLGSRRFRSRALLAASEPALLMAAQATHAHRPGEVRILDNRVEWIDRAGQTATYIESEIERSRIQSIAYGNNTQLEIRLQDGSSVEFNVTAPVAVVGAALVGRKDV